MSRHFSDDELVDRLYGVGESGGHLESCGECGQRWSEMRARREQLAMPAEVSSDFLAAQRRKIYARFGEEPQHGHGKLIAALAAACVLAAGLFFYHPEETPKKHHSEASDAQLFSEVYAMEEQSTEPRAGAPIHALFEDNQ